MNITDKTLDSLEVLYTVDLARVLQKIKINDNTYDIRYKLVFKAMYLAAELGYKTGQQKSEDNDEEWYILYIELPEGQVSWHMPSNDILWDGHDNNKKYERCDAYIMKHNSDKICLT